MRNTGKEVDSKIADFQHMGKMFQRQIQDSAKHLR